MCKIFILKTKNHWEKDHLNKWRDVCCLHTRGIKIVKIPIHPTLIYIFNRVLIKTSSDLFIETEKCMF